MLSLFPSAASKEEMSLLAGWFCFVQTTDGKVAEVYYPQNELLEVVNIKKGITATFQSHDGEGAVVESSTNSKHKALYR